MNSGSGEVYDHEFQCADDSAWYSVGVILNGETLTVKYQNFPHESYNVGDFTTIEAVDEFCQRFRPLSEQLQDCECYRIREGMRVCACLSSKDGGDLRFYDAIVDAVDYKDHLFEKIEEECLCTFVLSWLHGPNEGNLSPTNIADICIVRSTSPPNSTLASFSNLAKERIKKALLRSSSVSVVSLSGPTCPSGKRKSISPKDGLQDMEHSRKFLGRSVKCVKHGDQDQDIGGVCMNSIDETGSHHYVMIDNLEKDLSPTSIMEFIHKQTSISAQAYVFPSLSEESYTRGAIVLDSKAKLKQIYEFLVNPDHIIISSTGRPWIITEKRLRCGTFRTTIGSLMPKSQTEIIENKLKVVRLGTKEYSRAEGIRNLFMDFLEHQRQLHERLDAEVKKGSCTFHPF